MLGKAKIITKSRLGREDEAMEFLKSVDSTMCQSHGLPGYEVSEIAREYEFVQGLIAINSENWDTAIDMFETLAAARRGGAPNIDGLTINAAIAYIGKGDTRKAKGLLQGMVQGFVGDPDPWDLLDAGRVYHNLGCAYALEESHMQALRHLLTALKYKGRWLRSNRSSSLAYSDFLLTANGMVKSSSQVDNASFFESASVVCREFSDVMAYPGIVFDILSGNMMSRDELMLRVSGVVEGLCGRSPQTLTMVAAFFWARGIDARDSGVGITDFIDMFEAAHTCASNARSSEDGVTVYVGSANDYANYCYHTGRYEDGERCAAEALYFVEGSELARSVPVMRIRLLFNKCLCELERGGVSAAISSIMRLAKIAESSDLDDEARDDLVGFSERRRMRDAFSDETQYWMPLFDALCLTLDPERTDGA